MPFHQTDSIRYYTFDSLDDAGVTHAVFTRRGGLSPAPWSSLNVGGLLGDDPDRVYQNRVLSFQSMGLAPESVYDAWQVHGDEVICTDKARPPSQPHRKADAILTSSPEVTLFMRFADCVPVVLYDPVKKVIGLVHAGWKGTMKGAVTRALETMKLEFSSQPQDIQAALGPSIGPHHYEIGDDIADQVTRTFGQDAGELLPKTNGSVHFDLWTANQLLLDRAGVRRIEVSGLCTACHLEDWYSHRGEKGKTGRFGVLISLKSKRD
ncbi:MAG: peptidoglycan editing factor PgeF [Anaerolineales bacterium]|jgi:YfiH family protein